MTDPEILVTGPSGQESRILVPEPGAGASNPATAHEQERENAMTHTWRHWR